MTEGLTTAWFNTDRARCGTHMCKASCHPFAGVLPHTLTHSHSQTSPQTIFFSLLQVPVCI